MISTCPYGEKATILHHEANRPERLEMPQRYSRHYYDLYRMVATPVSKSRFSVHFSVRDEDGSVWK